MRQNIADPGSKADTQADKARLGDLLTMQMIYLFSVMRRSGVLAQRRLFGLSEIEWRIMVQLGAESPLSLNRLAELTLQDRGQLSRTVTQMVRNGLLTRTRRPGGPTVDIALAPPGLALHERMVERALLRDARLTRDLTAQQEAAMRQAVQHMIARAEEMLEEERQLG